MAPFVTNSNLYLSPPSLTIQGSTETDTPLSQWTSQWGHQRGRFQQRFPPLLMFSPSGDVVTMMSTNDEDDEDQTTTVDLVDGPHDGLLPPPIQRVDAFDEWDDEYDDDEEDENPDNHLHDLHEQFGWSPPSIQRVSAFDEWDDENMNYDINENDKENIDVVDNEEEIMALVDTMFPFDFVPSPASTDETHEPNMSWSVPESRRCISTHVDGDSSSRNVTAPLSTSMMISPSPLITSITVLEGDETRYDHHLGHSGHLQLPLLDHAGQQNAASLVDADESDLNAVRRWRLTMEGNRRRRTDRSQPQQQQHKVLYHDNRLDGPLADYLVQATENIQSCRRRRERMLFISTDHDDDNDDDTEDEDGSPPTSPSTPSIPEYIFVQND